LAMTSNGIGLRHRAAGLAEAGLSRVNISLDTVDRAGFARLTRRDPLASALCGIRAAGAAGLAPVKVNAVLMRGALGGAPDLLRWVEIALDTVVRAGSARLARRGRLESGLCGIRAAGAAGLAPVKVNAVLMRETLDGAPDLLRWCLDEGCELRFIEEMPLDADHEWARANMVTAAELLDVLGTRYRLTAAGREDPSAPAETWLVDGRPATAGISASAAGKCGDPSDRPRLPADGMLRSCLFSDQEFDLRGVLRAGASDEELAQLWRGAMWQKWA